MSILWSVRNLRGLSLKNSKILVERHNLFNSPIAFKAGEYMPETGNPVCGKCGRGVLLPFFSSDGRCVYFCTACKSRFSGYTQECMFNDEPIFSQEAVYSQAQSESPKGDIKPEPLSTQEPVLV